MTLPKLPNGFEYGLLFSIASGRQLNIFGEQMGMRRRLFEPDFLYKRRLAKEAIRRSKI